MLYNLVKCVATREDHNGVARALGPLLQLPRSRSREGRRSGLRFFARELFGNSAGIDSEIPAHAYPAVSDFHALDFKAVLARFQTHVVDDADSGNDEAEIESGFPPDAGDALQEFGALILVDQGNKAVAQFEGKRVEGNYGAYIGRRFSRFFLFLFFSRIELRLETGRFGQAELPAEIHEGSRQR